MKLETIYKGGLMMTELKSMLVTSEMMQAGIAPLLFTGGASNIQGPTGPIRNPGRDPLAKWLDENDNANFLGPPTMAGASPDNSIP